MWSFLVYSLTGLQLPENNDLRLLIDVAYECGKISKRFFSFNPKSWEKDNNAGPVTEADIEINQMLHNELLNNRPDYGWLSEETEDSSSRVSNERVFIIDPIDGTRSFIAGKDTFAHSLAIAENGKVVTAVIYLPIPNLLYTASDIEPSRRNGSLISTSMVGDIDNSKLLAPAATMDSENWVGPVPNFIREHRPSLAYRLCLVADGQFDALLTLRDCWEWDIAAGELIVRMAGGITSDRLNKPLLFNNPFPKTMGCHAAGKTLHTLINSQIKNNKITI